MDSTIQAQAIVQITDQDFQAGFEEMQEACYAEYRIRTDMTRVEVVRAILTEHAVEIGLSEQ